MFLHRNTSLLKRTIAVAPLATVAVFSLGNAASAASIQTGAGSIFSFDGTLQVEVTPAPPGDPFDTSLDFTPNNETVNLTLVEEGGAPGGAFDGFTSVTISDITYTISTEGASSIPFVGTGNDPFLDLENSTGPGPGQDTFTITDITAAQFTDILGGSVASIGFEGLFVSSDPDVGTIEGSGTFSTQFNLSAAEVNEALAAGTVFNQTYSSTFTLGEVPNDIPEPASITGLLVLGALGAGTSLRKRHSKLTNH